MKKIVISLLVLCCQCVQMEQARWKEQADTIKITFDNGDEETAVVHVFWNNEGYELYKGCATYQEITYCNVRKIEVLTKPK